MTNVTHRIRGSNLGTAIAVGVVAAVVAPTVVPPALGLIGLGSGGPIAGTFAAVYWQGSIGNVAAGSAFAGAQAVAMGAGVPLAWQVIGGTLVGGWAYAGMHTAQLLHRWKGNSNMVQRM